ncbi:hypothetical protein F7725_006998, partial [Dissostichus mawsoni]
MSSYKHKSGATKRKEKDKKDQGKPKLSKLDGYFFRPTPPPAGDEPEVVATASRVSSPSPSPPTTLVGVSQVYSDDDNNNRDDSAAASCSSRGEPGLTLDKPHPSPSGSLTAAPQGEEVPDTGNESSNRSPPHATPTGETQTTDHDVSCNYPLERFTTDRANYLENIEDANIKRYILKMGPCKPKGPFPKDKDNLYEQWKTNGTIDTDMERNLRNAAQFWRQVVERIVNVTLTLASSNLAFRGHREVLELLARYDPVLKELINRPEGIKRWALLSELMTPESRTITLKRLCPTRWSSRHDALVALRHRYGDIIKALVKISLTSDKNDKRNEASALKNAISKFRFLFLVNMQTKILENINCASHRLTDAESNFRVTVFNACLDIIIQQLSQRFTSLNATVNMFEAIHPNTLLQAKYEDLHQAAQQLIEHYSRDIAASFPGQLLSFRTCFRDQIQKLKS